MTSLELLTKIKDIIKKEKELTDYELAIEISRLNTDSSIMWSSPRLDDIIKRRITEHCQLNNIPFQEYHGVLPFKKYRK